MVEIKPPAISSVVCLLRWSASPSRASLAAWSGVFGLGAAAAVEVPVVLVPVPVMVAEGEVEWVAVEVPVGFPFLGAAGTGGCARCTARLRGGRPAAGP